MPSDHWTDRLSEYLDGELDARERAECEAHLESCARCAATRDELSVVVERASVLPEVPPSRDLWPEIEDRLEPRTKTGTASATGLRGRVLSFRRRRVSFSIPQLVAAAVALVVLSASSVWLLLPAAPGPVTVAGEPVQGSAVPIALAAGYDATVRELEAEFDRRRDTLDPETIRVVEANLAIIDGAIAEARAALAEDPSSGFLHTHLASAMRQKVDLLRQAATLESTEI
jgi:hypothetical protein